MLFDQNLVEIQGNFNHNMVKNQGYFSQYMVAWNSYFLPVTTVLTVIYFPISFLRRPAVKFVESYVDLNLSAIKLKAAHRVS